MKANNTRRKVVSRKEIIAQALVLATETGWHKLTVRALADRLGYAPPVLYEHFENKDHLLHTVIREGFLEMGRLMHEATNSVTDPREKLVNVALTRLAFAKEHEALNTLMFSTNCPCGQQEMIIEGMCTARNLVRQFIQQITGRTDDCHELVTNFIAIVRGYSYLATELPTHLSGAAFFSESNPADALAAAIRRFIKSIQPSP